MSYSKYGNLFERWQIGSSQLFDTIKNVNPIMLIFAMLLIVIQQFLSINRIYFLARAQDIKISYKDSFYFTICGLFLAAVTPFQSGGIPFQTYILNKSGGKLSKSLAVISFRGVLSGFVLVLFLPFIFIEIGDLLSENELIRNLTGYLFVLYGVIIVFALFATLQNRRSHRFFLKTTYLIKNKKVRKNIQRKLNKFFIGIRDFLTSYKIFFTKGFKYTSKAALIAFFELCIYFLVPPIIALGLKPEENVLGIFLTGIVLTYLLAFSPTPGASGVAEMSGLSFSFFWDGPVPALILLWRVVSSYIPALFGGISLIHFIRRWGPDKKRLPVNDTNPE